MIPDGPLYRKTYKKLARIFWRIIGVIEYAIDIYKINVKCPGFNN